MAERYAQAWLHFHKYSKALRIRSRRQLLGFTPYGGAASKPKGPGIPNDTVGHAKDGGEPVTQRGSVAYATHSLDKEIEKHKVVTQTVGTQTLIPITDARALQQWRALQSSQQLELQTLQHKISRILQDAASGYSPTEGLQSRIDLIIWDTNAVNRSCSSEAAVDFQPIDKTLDLRGPPVAVPYFVSPAPKYRPSRHLGHASHHRGTVKSATRRKKAETKQEGQGVATSHRGAMSPWPESV